MAGNRFRAWIRNNWDIAISYLIILIGFLAMLICVKPCEGMGCLACPAFLLLGLYAGFIFSLVTLTRTFVKKKNKLRLIWVSPILLFGIYVIFLEIYKKNMNIIIFLGVVVAICFFYLIIRSLKQEKRKKKKKR